MSGKYSSDRSGSDSRAVRTGVDPRVVSCLDEPGGERTLVRLARDIARRETDSTPTRLGSAGSTTGSTTINYSDWLQPESSSTPSATGLYV